MNNPKDAYAKHVGSFDEEAYNNAYYGEWLSELTFAIELFNQEFKITGITKRWIDYEKYRAKIFEFDYFSINTCRGAIWVFKRS